jgi:tetratricopeptide (TPR) repeat protein
MAQAGQHPAALAGAEDLARIAPTFPDAWFIASYINLVLGRPRQALQAVERANQLARSFAPWRLHELLCLDACGMRAQAITLGNALVEEKVEEPRFFATVGQVLFRLQQFGPARRAQQNALALAPDAAGLHLGLASIELALGDIPAARAACDRSLVLGPGNPDALHFRSGLSRKTPADNHVAELKASLVDPPPAPAAHARILFALAKELEDLGEYEESFAVLQRAAALYRPTLRFDLDEELQFLEATRSTWTRQRVTDPEQAPQPADGQRTPIFIVGLPRTGTTLVERIVGAHSQVHSAGELPDFIRQLSGMMDTLPGAAERSRAELVAASPGLDFAALGRRYLEQVGPLAGDRPRFIDKFPQNSIYLGLIHRALPNAKLVLVWRHPMDTCYSMFKQVFAPDTFQFSYDLDELARYYVAHRALMRHWIDVLGERLHVIHYEDLVENQEAETRRLLDFLGLPWEQACLDFHRNPAPASTASASQVRQAIYRSSIEKWRSHGDSLRTLEQQLRDAGCLDDWRLSPHQQ